MTSSSRSWCPLFYSRSPWDPQADGPRPMGSSPWRPLPRRTGRRRRRCVVRAMSCSLMWSASLSSRGWPSMERLLTRHCRTRRLRKRRAVGRSWRTNPALRLSTSRSTALGLRTRRNLKPSPHWGIFSLWSPTVAMTTRSPLKIIRTSWQRWTRTWLPPNLSPSRSNRRLLSSRGAGRLQAGGWTALLTVSGSA